jgi:hypothetical protein
MKYSKAYSIAIIPMATHVNIYWPQDNEITFCLRYCIFEDGKVIPKMKAFKTYQDALDYLPIAQSEQGY